ncbi:Anaphase-promoting complex subunit 1 [Serendipita sp. 398]|nr:Anaphase-promoting complex subunit 1 [Serendipita sp. 398]
MSFNSADAYFGRSDSNPPTTNAPSTELLETIRDAIQHESRKTGVLGRLALERDTELLEELLWSSKEVVWLVGGCVRRQWSFMKERDEIRTACWAYFEESKIQRVEALRNTRDSSALLDGLLEQPSQSVFGPYGDALRGSYNTMSKGIGTTNSDAPCDLPAQTLVRAICVVFRTSIRIYCDDGSDFFTHIPFLSRHAWPIHPFGLAIEEEHVPELYPWAFSTSDYAPILYALAHPLQPVTPFGLAHSIIQTSRGQPLIFQEEHRFPNKDMGKLHVIKPGEHVIFVDDYASTPFQLIMTVDTRLQMVHSYTYAISSPKNECSPTDILRRSREASVVPPNLTDIIKPPTNHESIGLPSRWLMEHTPVPQGWREPMLPNIEVDRETNDAQSVLVTPLLEFPDDGDEEVFIEPIYWLQRLNSIHVGNEVMKDWSDIRVIPFGGSPGQHIAGCYAVFFPRATSYRLLQVSWLSAIPLIPTSSLQAIFDAPQIPALSITRIRALSGDRYDLLILNLDHSLTLVSASQSLHLGLKWGPKSTIVPFVQATDVSGEIHENLVKPIEFLGVYGHHVTIKIEDGTVHPVYFNFQSNNLLVQEIVATLRFALSSPDFDCLLRRYLALWSSRSMSRVPSVELECLWTALCDLLGSDHPFVATNTPKGHNFYALSNTKSHLRFSYDNILSSFKLPLDRSVSGEGSVSSQIVAPVILALHLLGQSIMIDTTRTSDLRSLVPVIIRLSRDSASEWSDYWYRICPDEGEAWTRSDRVINSHPHLPILPPDIFQHCHFGTRWIQLSAIPSLFQLETSSSHTKPSSCRLLDDLVDFFSLIRDDPNSRELGKSEALAHLMVQRDWNLKQLEKLPLALKIPIKEALRLLQNGPRLSYPAATYKLIDRSDLYYLVSEVPPRPIEPSIREDNSPSTVGRFVRNANQIVTGQVGRDGYFGLLPNNAFTEIKWTDDRRLEEVQLMLQSSRIPVIKIQYTLPPNESDKEHAALVLRISERTLSLPPGRALFTYGCLSEASADAYVIPRMELAVRIMPLNAVMVLEEAKLTTETKNWAEFHNGVAAGLRLSPHSTMIESSWIQFAKPSELTAEHAGFLFGLGLNGHLKHVDTWNTFSYLSPKHDQTSMAMLLGLAASNVGSSSHYITRLIAVHTPALLPIRTVDINVSLLTQSAGLVAMGLVFLGTGDRRLADIALREIAREDIMVPTHGSDNREAYTVSAALAFGMIMVGRGSRLQSPADSHWVDRLRLLIHGERKLSKSSLPKNFDLNITAPGACMALAMLYLKSGRRDIADIVSVPTTRVALNTVPPNLLLLRTLAKCLILWDDIYPSLDWVNAKYMPMKPHDVDNPNDVFTSNALDLASYNVIAGACLALALKYAGSASADAWAVVVNFYDVLIRGVYANARTYEHSIRRQATRDAINVLSCAMAMIMAGSGHVDCLQRLRYAHGKYSTPNKFGMHMANHMAMGLLFLGGGRYTLGTSNAAICALLAAFYPRFPLFGYDNRFHLQALRHLWVLAVEPRCLITRDVESQKIILLPIKIRVLDVEQRHGNLQFFAPTLTPDVDTIRSLRVDNPRYWPIFLNFDAFPRLRYSFIQNQTLWVKRRRSNLGFFEDPYQTRSTFLRSSGGATGDIVCLDTPEILDENEQSSRDFSEFMASFTDDASIAAFAERLCIDITREKGQNHANKSQRHERAWVAYCQASLMDCFSGDKPSLLGAYMDLYVMRVQSPEDSDTLGTSLTRLSSLQSWYKETAITRNSLLRGHMLSSVLGAGAWKVDTLRDDPEFMLCLRTYVNGRGVPEGTTGSDRARRRQLAFFLSQTKTPSASMLMALRKLYVTTVGGGKGKSRPPDALRSALMMVMKETVSKTLGVEWQWQAIRDVIVCWREG